MNRLLGFCWACLFGLPYFPVNAQRIEERFEQLTTKQGLSNPFVQSILQDQEGFMWFGTGNGLNKYDGYTFTVYQSDPTAPQQGLGGNNIRDLLESRSGDLWAATGAGLHHVNKRTGVISPFRVNRTSSDQQDNITNLIEDRGGQIWLSTRGGLNQFNPKTNKFIVYGTPNNALVGDLAEDNTGRIWVTTEKGLYNLNQQTRTFSLTPFNWPSAPRTIYRDTAGIFWISVVGSIDLYRFNPISREFKHYPLRQQGMTGEYISSSNSILEESADELWVGTRINRRSGLYRLNKQSGRFVAYSINANLNVGLNNSSVLSLYKDRNGTLWVGTFNGINKLIRQPVRFRTQPVIYINPAIQIALNYITAVCEDKQGRVWLSNYSGSLYQYDRPTGQLIPYHIPSTAGPYRDAVALHADRSDTLWIAIREGDLYALTPDRRRFIRYAFDKGIQQRTITEDRQGRIWVAGRDRIAALNRRTGKFTYYRYQRGDTAGLPTPNPLKLYASRTGAMWVGTGGDGLFRLDPTSRKFKPYGSDKAQPHRRLTDPRAQSLYEDPEGVLWVGTFQGGLNRLDPKTGIFSAFTTKNGLPDNNITTIQPDQRGFLWLGTDRGLGRLNPRTRKCRTYTESDGLQDALFTGASARTHSGHLLFGTPSGLCLFHPDSLPDNRRIPPVYITGLRVLDKNQDLSSEPIELTYKDNYLSFDFVALNYTAPEKNQYAYQLVGIDKNWVNSGNRRFASYPNLDPGEYTFKVKASNNDGIWNEQGASLKVIIHPPWWRTWWAYGFYGLCLLAGVVLLGRYQRRRLIEAEREKARERELAQAREIERTNKELQTTLDDLKSTQSQLIQKEKMASLGELTAGIAHEIQNPLNFVNNFSEVSNELLEELKEEINADHKDDALAIADDLSQNLQKISQHGTRASSIVKGMLEHSRTSTGQRQSTDLNALCEEYLRLAYHGFRAKDKEFNADLKTNFDPDPGIIELVPQEIGRVLLNLFNNAFYAVQQKQRQQSTDYKPTVSVSTKRTSEHVEIKVKDNGIGIPELVRAKIFQPFFTTKPTGEGTGLGLSLAYDIVTKGHGGTMTVETKEGEYAEFTLHLPTGK